MTKEKPADRCGAQLIITFGHVHLHAFLIEFLSSTSGR